MKNLRRMILPLLAFFLAFPSCQRSELTGGDSIIIWHWMTDREAAFNELARRYKEQTGVDVRFQLYAPSDTYTQKVRVGAQTNSLPEIYGVLGESRDLASFIKAGHVVKLDKELGSGKGSWESRFYEEALQTAYFPNGNRFGVPKGYYGIPLDVTTIPMIYNRALFKKAGLNPDSPPATWSEFIAAGKALHKIGVSGFVSGWGETWLIFSLATDMASNVMGNQKLMDTFKGKVPYTDPDWMTVFNAFEAMQKAGFADPSLVTLENKNAEKKFASGRAGMTFNGSWAVNVYGGMNSNLDYRPFRVPALRPNNKRPVWGGAGTVFYVNAKSPKKEKAIAFLKWFTEPEQAKYLLDQTRNLPTVRLEGVEISPILSEFSSLMENSIHPSRFSASEDPRITEALTKGIQSILIAEKTPKQVAEEIQTLKEKIAANQS